MFSAYLDESSKEELQAFARGNGTTESPMHIKILDAFESLKKQQNSLHNNVNSLKLMIQQLENKPKDSSYDEEIKELKSEESALLTVLQEISKKNVFNFLSDEGLLPNYAFPEAGIILRAVLYRKSDEELPSARKKYEKLVYEYNRSASSALSEFAPSNSFYVDGRKLTIDQVDLTTAQSALWRLCPNCSHAQLETAGRNTAACPQCGSPAWADSGQVRNMLKVQMVYQEEWNRVAIAQEAITRDQYLKASRNGRGTRLDRRKRLLVWQVLDSYQNLMKEHQIRDINTSMYECTKLLQRSSIKPQYAHIIVDEGQDLSDNAYRLIRALAGPEHANDLFIVGDAHQRIYRNRPILSKCGINVRGRSSILKINYRTTEEIRHSAFSFLEGLSFDDLDESTDNGTQCQSLTHGEPPIIRNFPDANAEFNFICTEIRKLQDSGILLKEICIVARTKNLVNDYLSLLTKAGIRSYAIKRNQPDNRSFDGIRVATMHRVKGLEFKYVFIAALNHRVVPLASAINHMDPISEKESITSEKCLLYVAMTRAQKGVYITSYGTCSQFLHQPD